MRYNLEAIAVSIDWSPSVRRALLLIDDASIGIDVADNGRLPQLDLAGQMRWNGLEGGLGSSYDNLVEGGLVDYLLGVQFSQAIGNQAAEAVYRRSRLERSAAVVAYQRAIQQTVLQVKNALRDVRTSSLLIGQTRALRLAQAENLRALRVTQKTMAQLTPEFLALKFQRQDGLATARVREVQALRSTTPRSRGCSSRWGRLQMNRIELQIDSGSIPLESAVSRWSEPLHMNSDRILEPTPEHVGRCTRHLRRGLGVPTETVYACRRRLRRGGGRRIYRAVPPRGQSADRTSRGRSRHAPSASSGTTGASSWPTPSGRVR